jgi:hypothetical protein
MFSLSILFTIAHNPREKLGLHFTYLPKSNKLLKKTYNSGYSLVVTHLTTNPPVRCLNRAERTGSLVFNVLWSYVKDIVAMQFIIKHDVVHPP